MTAASRRATPDTRPRHRLDGVAYAPPAEADRLFGVGAWLPITTGDALHDAAARAPHEVAVVAGEERITWAELEARALARAAGLLGLGVRPGDRVLIQMGTGAEIVVTVFALFTAGIVPVCAVPQYGPYEIAGLTERTGAVAHIVEPAAAGRADLVGVGLELQASQPTLRHLLVAGQTAPQGAVSLSALDARSSSSTPTPTAPAAEDVAAFQLSGGTTGVPKVIPRHHAEYLGYASTWADRLAISENDVLLWALSLSHNAGMIAMLLPALLRRARLVLLPRFEPESFLRAVERERVTVSGSIGPIGPRLLQHRVDAYDLSSLRCFFALNRGAAIEAHLGVPTCQMYGMTEGLLMSSHPSDPAEARHRTNGRPTSPFDEVRIADPTGEEVAAGEVGEMLFRGPSSLRAYYRADEATREAVTADGFVRTGDLVRADDVGGHRCYVFAGRSKENIDRGGEKFGVAAIEEFMAEHPSVTEARVVGMPDPEFGERVCAFVVLPAGTRPPSVDDMAAFLVERGLARFKAPERIEVVDEFPVTGVGKLDRAALRRLAERLAAGTPRAGLPAGATAAGGDG